MCISYNYIKIIYPRKLSYEIQKIKFSVFQQMIKCKHFFSFLQEQVFFTAFFLFHQWKFPFEHKRFKGVAIFSLFLNTLYFNYGKTFKQSSRVWGKLLGYNFTTHYVIYLCYSKSNSKNISGYKRAQCCSYLLQYIF